MSRFAACLGILLHVLGALVAPGLHLHVHHGGAEASASGEAHAGCSHAHAAPDPARTGAIELEAPGHDERDCALCEMAQWVGESAPRAIAAATWAEEWASAEAPRCERDGRAVDGGAGTRGPPERAS
jgi:hypothetical protein